MVGERFPEAHFVLAGDGVLRPDVEREIAHLALGDRFHLLGWRRDVEEILAALDVFLLTSLWEGLPRVVLQARASGIPVVATRVDGTPEAIDEGITGFLVDPGHPEEAAARVVRLLDDSALRRVMGEEARKGLEEFDIDQMVERQDAAYQGLLELGSQSIPRAAAEPT
jgi:glycosyltransferase involved in cell wall biosynthesis